MKLTQQIPLLLAILGIASLALLWQKEKAVSAEKQRQIKDLHALIERVSGERITLNITNSFKNTAV
ncbi:MAG: hypothetical protein ACRC3G_08285, partial [Bacteroidales bacterium]